mgnify:FL=1
MSIKIIHGWIDDYSNAIIILNINGKVFSFIANISESIPQWSYFFGVGTLKPTETLPAGRADYLTGDMIEREYSKIITDVLRKENPHVTRISNKGNVSWSPKTEQEKLGLANIVELFENINKTLSSNGIIYSKGDKYIYGEDLSKEDILKWNLSQPVRSESKQQKSTGATKNAPSTERFIEALKPKYRETFGKTLVIGSTHRTALEQAKAMRYPLQSGDYDSLYSSLGEDAEKIKKLISAGDYENAAEIIETTKLTEGSHMAGNGIDVGFNANGLGQSDYNKFKELVIETSKESGIAANVNWEKTTHFHITVGT